MLNHLSMRQKEMKENTDKLEYLHDKVDSLIQQQHILLQQLHHISPADVITSNVQLDTLTTPSASNFSHEINNHSRSPDLTGRTSPRLLTEIPEENEEREVRKRKIKLHKSKSVDSDTINLKIFDGHGFQDVEEKL